MHELYIATNLLRIIEEQREKYNFEKVERIYLKVGEFSSVVPEALEFSFKIASQGTIAEKAEVVIELVLLMLKCKQCNEVFRSETFIFICPKCSSTSLEILSGRELQIESIEV